MKSKSDRAEGPVSRRNFLSGGVAAGAAFGLGSAATGAAAESTDPAGSAVRKVGAVPAHDLPAEQQSPEKGGGRQYIIARPGADFMVDVLKTLEIEYVAANPGSTFRGLQESLVNYGGNRKPEWRLFQRSDNN